MGVLSAFADEISPDLAVQVATLKRLDVPGLDLRSVDGVNVLDLSPAVLAEVKKVCADHGLHVQAIGSPVNKVPYGPERQPQELEKLRKAIAAAYATGTRRIRIFTPEGGETDATLAWMSEQIALATAEDVVLLHENDAKYWGAYPANAQVLFAELGSAHFRMAFDFANTVLLGFSPVDDWLPWMVPYLDTLHIKDALAAEHKVVPAGQGDGQLGFVLANLKEQGWDGPLTLEPHLQAAGPLGGFSGAELFEVAANALRSILP
jgi:sugar phosphate isomerase/epimerase